MQALIGILFVLFMGIWRSAFGKSGFGIPVIKYRFVQHIIGFAGIFCFLFFARGFLWYIAAYVGIVILGLEMALGHGSAYDIGVGGYPDEEMRSRYQKTLGWKICSKMFDEIDWYGIGFDMCLFCLRYTIPLILVLPFFNPLILFVGAACATDYGVYRYSVTFQKDEDRLFDNEFILGAIIGFAIAFG